MALRLIDAVEGAPDRFFVVLTGNIHNRVESGGGRMGDRVAARLTLVALYSLNLSYTGGSAWICTSSGCGAQELKGRGTSPALRVALDSKSAAYDGTFYVGSITASPPARD